MSLKTEEPTVDVLALFPKDADTKPKVGEIQPSNFFKFEANMNSALSKTAPIDANVPRRLGMRQLFAEETEWKALAGETFADYSECGSATGRPAVKPWPTLPKRPRRLKPIASFSSQRWPNTKKSLGSANQSHQFQPVPPYSAAT